MKKIWLQKTSFTSRQASAHRALQILAISFLILGFGFFGFYHRLTSWLFSPNKIDIFHDLNQISFYFSLVDQELSSQIQTLDTVIQSYLKGENVLKTKEAEILQLRTYAKDHKSYLKRVGFSNYEKAFTMLEDAWPLREEIFKLLGRDQSFNYLIPLQNSNESRPNGGFFGSFAFVSLSGGHITQMQIIDSYLPDYIAPNARLDLPNRYIDAYGTKQVWFIAGNKFGFTDKDGKNLKLLYEKIFNIGFDPQRKEKLFNPTARNQLFAKNIKGVIFLDSELISQLFPSFRSKAREWQFINANIDIIRGENRSNKKELYIADLQKYLRANALKLASATLNDFQTMLHKWYINIYLSNTTPQMWHFLDQRDLTTVYNQNFLYFWGTNIAGNKSDAFLKKQIEILDQNGKVILSTEDRKLKITDLPSGKYQLAINYTFDVPKTYTDSMLSLQKKYHITMTDREKYILAIQDFSWDPTAPRYRQLSQETIHFPSHRTLWEIRWDLSYPKKFKSDFSQAITFQTTMHTTPENKRITIDFTIP